MNARPLALLLLISPLSAAQDPPSTPTVVFLADGADARMTTNSGASSDWYDPAAILTQDWRALPAGFGPKERFAEVSTVTAFQQIRIRQTFDITTPCDSLTLSLKHKAEPLDVFLNGQPVLSLALGEIPVPDAAGFRHYDLTSHIGDLAASGNLLALHVRGSIAVPILHGTTSQLGVSSIAIDPTTTRLVEGGEPLRFRVFRNPSLTGPTRVYLGGVGLNATALSDFEIRRNGTPVGIINRSGLVYFFNASFDGTDASTVYELAALDDSHAEAQETIRLEPGISSCSIPLIVSANDVLVTRTASSGEGSLRQAIENAENMPGLETISFSDDEGVPFPLAPVTVALENGSPGPNGLREGFTIEGPPPPGRVTIQATGGPLFYISGANGAAAAQDLTLRRLVIQGASLAVESLRYEGTMLIEDCEFIGNGQALELYGRTSPPVVRRCLFTENSQGCIDHLSGLPPVIENCTFASNGDTCLDFRYPVPLEHCTFSGNTFRIASGQAFFRNCLLAGASSDIKLTNSNFDQGGNLFAGVLMGGQPVTPTHPDSLATSASEARLGDLGFHGGFTRTLPILADSPALDLGLPPEPGSPAFDQRGEPFLRRVGPAPDAGAYELQLDAAEIVIGLETEPIYDAFTGLYFQFLVIHNTTPWTLSGFRLWTAILPDDAALYNGSGDDYLDVAGPIPPSEYRIVMLQYTAPRPDLRLLPILSVSLLPDSDLPVSGPEPGSDLELAMEDGCRPCLRFRTVPGHGYQIEVSEDLQHWRACGPAVSAESARTWWRDPDAEPPTARYYRVGRPLGN